MDLFDTDPVVFLLRWACRKYQELKREDELNWCLKRGPYAIIRSSDRQEILTADYQIAPKLHATRPVVFVELTIQVSPQKAMAVFDTRGEAQPKPGKAFVGHRIDVAPSMSFFPDAIVASLANTPSLPPGLECGPFPEALPSPALTMETPDIACDHVLEELAPGDGIVDLDAECDAPEVPKLGGGLSL